MKWLITGGAGFIGCNSAKRIMDTGDETVVFDNLSRRGTDVNLKWLKENGKFEFIKGDVRNFNQLKEVFKKHRDIDVVLHLAAQVAVTTSVANPREDFETNALGTFNVCEAVRQFNPDAVLLYASTNKVYGEMKDVKVRENKGRYEYADLPAGISESRVLDFHSPYGCSKGAADQYVLDYSRIYGLKTVSFRQSCIYGYHQFGIEDQGWIAWFIICAVSGRGITIYGDGKQIRDILFIDDLIDCYLKAVKKIDITNGNAYNIGGGPENTISLLELIKLIEKMNGKKIRYKFSEWRPGDQKVFVCNIEKAKRDFGWFPKVKKEEGIELLYKWVRDNKSYFKK
jgi:CDP-paratose 2-epimerase